MSNLSRKTNIVDEGSHVRTAVCDALRVYIRNRRHSGTCLKRVLWQFPAEMAPLVFDAIDVLASEGSITVKPAICNVYLDWRDPAEGVA